MSNENIGSRPAQRRGAVLRNQPIARDTFRLAIAQPEIAARILPGQFVMVRVPGRSDPLLARPFAMYDTGDGDGGIPAAIEVVYLVMGAGTRSLSRLSPGAEVDLWGPLGNTFPVLWPNGPPEHLFVAAGGIGQTPFVAVLNELLGLRRYGSSRAVERPERITFAWGVRSAEYLAALEDFRLPGVEVLVATDDGTQGYHGFVTELLEKSLESTGPPTAVFGCGPEPMLERLSEITDLHSLPCWVSLERKMACGYGVCFSCVCPIRDDDGWDYRRTCLEGPVFPAQQIVWKV